MKQVQQVFDAPRGHWVGDGFPVRSMFSYQGDAAQFSPFLLLDYAGPAHFDPSAHRRGVGQHPHRGFETVTIVYDGEVEHHDSTGAGGQIGPGDVQWMTAASGILHEEYHASSFARTGGAFEMIQLWVNLPARDKLAAPGYQTLLRKDIPVLPLPDDAGSLRVIAGDYAGAHGPARTFTPIWVMDVSLKAGKHAELPLPQGWTGLLMVRRGTLLVNGEQIVREAQLVSLARAGEGVRLEANNDVEVFVMAGEPIDEPIVGYGPFVMNSQQEIRQAIADFNGGRFIAKSATG
ncbi:pirin family protein [Corticibacter populi]|uniref:Pirin family protein n=1 Tax=Corticibacter populi TaxID=1550736 RepID=A0A3M6QYP7_9BURK|nr:pirin family protein [Corticibacter populi]RMX08108.1 pirin family protein [Corticibacter populi]RZS35358.1 hypothetical protein EV687_0422 [Corticibacter populi]